MFYTHLQVNFKICAKIICLADRQKKTMDSFLDNELFGYCCFSLLH